MNRHFASAFYRKAIFDSLNNGSLKYTDGFNPYIPDAENSLRNFKETLNADEPRQTTFSWHDESRGGFGYNQTMGHSDLWNAMVHPLLNMTIFGVLWYQGEHFHSEVLF